MIGAIAGDIIGSIYEWAGIKTKEFPLFGRECSFTDDSVLTVAVAHVLLDGGSYSARFREYYRRYPYAGYGGYFHRWAQSSEAGPYGSFGNGSAMRVGPIGYAFEDLETVLAEAKRSAEVTHNHPEGVKGAQATAAAVFLARHQTAKSIIRSFVEREFGYDLSRTLDDIRPDYRFDETCQGTVPAALIAFLEATDFEDALRNAVSLGGDSDTLACIAGSIAGAYYGVPSHIELEARTRLDGDLRDVTDRFAKQFVLRSNS
ncbi:MAG: ADP-ribosylglycohydrolase family protein [Bryobacteraceae bacterium]